MDLVIYFEELNYEEIQQVAAYDWTALLSKYKIDTHLDLSVDQNDRNINAFFHKH